MDREGERERERERTSLETRGGGTRGEDAVYSELNLTCTYTAGNPIFRRRVLQTAPPFILVSRP